MAQVTTSPAGALPTTEALRVGKQTTGPVPEYIQQRYQRERAKRLRADGSKQFGDLQEVERLQKFQSDPWLHDKSAPPAEGDRTEILVLGAGYGGLLYAVRLLEAGFKHEDIRITDSANGFGGTWYWNRYPGLRCDIESYIYMPLLEETGYMPTEKYCTGLELQQHADRIAKQYKLTDRAWFQRTVSKLEWDDRANEWVTHYTVKQPDGSDSALRTMHSRFVCLATGVTLVPRIAKIPGMSDFKGDMFHSARWDYNMTGGSPTDRNLAKLKDKAVGIIGTGASAIQIVPALAESAKKLYVFQRTPTSVDRRGNEPTDAGWWKREHSKPGWQRARRDNFNDFLANKEPKPKVDLVHDGWTTMPSYSVMVGNPEKANEIVKDPSKIAPYVESLNILDLARQDKLRKRVDDTIKDPAIAEQLKPWYPGWCKRPCFSDEYLDAYNRPNVTLVDTDGQGVERVTENGAVVNGKEYKLDMLILGTGYRSPFHRSPAGRVDIEVSGRNKVSLDKKWMTAVTTLHGMMSHDFPNLCWPGLIQAGGTPCFTDCMDHAAIHASKILAHAASKTGGRQDSGSSPYKYSFVVEATAEAEEAWSTAIASTAGVFAASAGCTPGYINGEGENDRETSPEEQMVKARGALWGKGYKDFLDVLGEWRAKGDFAGVEIRAAS